MASVIDNNERAKRNDELKASINKIDADLQQSIDRDAEQALASAQTSLEKLLAQLTTPDARGVALFCLAQKLIPHAIIESKATLLYQQLIDNLLEQADIQLVLFTANQAPYSILYELVISTHYCAATRLLVEKYLKKVANPETVILQKITPPLASLLATDAIKACVTENNSTTLEILLPYIATTQYKYACWQLLSKGKQETIDVALAWLKLNYKNEFLLADAREGNTEVVQLLLDNGADINYKSLYDASPLMVAARGGHLETVRLLIERGANIDSHAVYSAVGPGGANRLEIIKLLLDKGAVFDEAHDFHFGRTPLLYAAEFGYLDIVRLLLDRGALINRAHRITQVTPLIVAARNRHLAVVELLLDRGANIQQADEYGFTALINKHVDIVNLLLDRAPGQLQQYGGTAIIEAAFHGRINIIEVLLARGIHINEANQSGDTALIIAVRKNQLATVEFLLNRGADINIRDAQGYTVLDIAHSAGPMLTLLLDSRNLNERAGPRPG